MSLDSYASGVSVRTAHPRGQFDGVVFDVKAEKTKAGQDMFVIKVKTRKGVPPDVRFARITDAEFERALVNERNGDPTGMKRVNFGIQYLKSSLVKTGMVDEKTVDGMGYSECVRLLPQLKNRKVSVIVKEQKNNPQYDQTDLAYLVEEHKATSDRDVMSSAPVRDTHPSDGFTLDEVPF